MLIIQKIVYLLWYKYKVLSLLLLPMEIIYLIVITIRRYCYKCGWCVSIRLPVPVIIVGNINVGGSGKTPLTLWIAQFLIAQGWRVGIISRGYGGKIKNIPRLVMSSDDPQEVGDEPIILARHSKAPMAICKNRVKAADLLITQYQCNCLIADDGLQHYRLMRDLEIAVIDYAQGFGNGHCLPVGPLREPITRLITIPLRVANGTPHNDEYQMSLIPHHAILISDDKITRPLSDFHYEKIHAVAGIGNPERFFNMLTTAGLNIIAHPFPDHHLYQPQELEFGDNLPILMTEKDAVKCVNFSGVKSWYVPITTHMNPQFGDQILRLIGAPHSPKLNNPLRFIVIRRDNIGDLVCTIPIFNALHKQFPSAEIYALVTSYNHAVLANQPSIKQLFWYNKAKHQNKLRDKISAYWQMLVTLIKLRNYKFDYAIIPISLYEPRALRLARLIGAKRIIGFGNQSQYKKDDLVVNLPPLIKHEVERAFHVLTPLGITDQPGNLQIYPDHAALNYTQQKLAAQNWQNAGMLIGIHISARKPSQRWATINFINLIKVLYENYQARFILFWSPGEINNLAHPGDDDKAHEILTSVKELSVLAFPSSELKDLIAGIAMCNVMICSDGGAMHIAAGLGKPIICLFGKSDAYRWHPWGVPYELLQSVNQDVSDISVNDVRQAFANHYSAK